MGEADGVSVAVGGVLVSTAVGVWEGVFWVGVGDVGGVLAQPARRSAVPAAAAAARTMRCVMSPRYSGRPSEPGRQDESPLIQMRVLS